MTRVETIQSSGRPFHTCEPVNVFLSKTVYPLRLRSPGTVQYAIVIENYSPRTISDVTIRDLGLSPFCSVCNLKLNGMPLSGDLLSGVVIPSMPALSGARVTFEAGVSPDAPKRIANHAEASYRYLAEEELIAAKITSDQATLEVLPPQCGPKA